MKKDQRRKKRNMLLHQADALLGRAMRLSLKEPLTAEEIKEAQFKIDDALTRSEKDQ